MGDCSGAHHDPDGPVVVADDVPLAVVRRALGPGTWLQRPGAIAGWRVLITRDRPLADDASAQGIPVVVASDDAAALGAQLRSFEDGRLITTAEAEALAWIEAIRAEEERNQRDARRRADARVEELQAQVDHLEAHITAIEASRSWALARRLVRAKDATRRVLTPWRRR